MREYKKRLDEIKSLFDRSNNLNSEAYSINPEISTYDEILSLFEEAKKVRKGASKKLDKLASDLDFRILKNINDDGNFMDVWYSINRQVERAIEAFYNISQFEINIKLMEYGN